MNRIILIGNGFDKAHGLQTGYEDFINWYWNMCANALIKCNERTMSDGLCTFTLKTNGASWQSFLFGRIDMVKYPRGKDFIDWIMNEKGMANVVQAHLLAAINKSIADKKWVDIENEYYRLLKKSITNPESLGCTPEMLNNQLKQIQNLLTQYLSLLNPSMSLIDEIKARIYQPIRDLDIAIAGLPHLWEHCRKWAGYGDMVWSDLMRRYGIPEHLLISEIHKFQETCTSKMADGSIFVGDFNAFPKNLILPEAVMLLSFNYTYLSDWYNLPGVGFTNHIHGDLSNPNGMIFGYGDELDDDYKSLLKQEDNECLQNIKSFKYSESDRYRQMLSFIEAAPFQIYIMGHSCGNSDRTLLNTLFEHKNCVSIKPFYYQKADGSDNYLEIVQNISRNFKDMKLMRDRVVNKTFCEPLPQITK